MYKVIHADGITSELWRSCEQKGPAFERELSRTKTPYRALANGGFEKAAVEAMESEGIALRLMHLYRLHGAATDGRARAAIQHEIDKLSAELDQAFTEADLAWRDTESERIRRH